MRKIAVLFVVLALAASVSLAEMNRPLYTRENRYPELRRPEVGVFYEYKELQDDKALALDDDADLSTANLFTRIRPFEDLALRANVPFSRYSPASGSDQNGIGDVSIGADLIAYQDIFDYPYVIPHADYTFDTGDDDEHLGGGEKFATLGVGVGTIVHDKFHWILDASYKVFDDSENAFVFGGTFMWELSDDFAAIAETKFEEKPDHAVDEDSYAQFYTGGLAYQATDKLEFGVYGTGGAHNTDEDVAVSVKASLSL